VGSRPVPTHPPKSLAEVNELLAGREARVTLDDGTAVTGEGAAVFPDSVRFTTGKPALPTPRVRRITYERDRFSPATGAGVGALVGVGVVGACLLTPDESDLLCIVLGGVAVMGSALIGLGFGMLEDVGEQEHVAYEGPVSRYAPMGAN